MQAVILAGGLATRLYPVTLSIPKCMIDVLGKPFLWWQFELLKKNNITNIVLCVGNLSEQIESYFGDGSTFGVSIKYSKENPENLLGTGGAICNAKKYLDDVFLVLYGDSYLPFDFLSFFSFFEEKKKKGVMSVFLNDNFLEPSNVVVEEEYVSFYDKKEKRNNMRYIDYGASIFRKSVFDNFSSNLAFDLSIVHKKLIQEKELLAYPVSQRFYQIGTFDGIQELIDFLQKKENNN